MLTCGVEVEVLLHEVKLYVMLGVCKYGGFNDTGMGYLWWLELVYSALTFRPILYALVWVR